MASGEEDEKKNEKMKKIEEQIRTTIEGAKRKKIDHQRFDEVQKPIRCIKCGKVIFRYSHLPFTAVVCPDCKLERMEKRSGSKKEIVKTENKELISRKTYEIIRTEAGTKVRKKELEKDEQK